MNETAVTDFDHWVRAEYAAGDPRGFTALVLLVKITSKDVVPISSTFLHVIGDELDWGSIGALMAGSGKRWDGVAFFVCRDPAHSGPLDNTSARLYLLDRQERVKEDRLAMNDGHFFDAWGRRLAVEEDGTRH